MYVLFSSDYKLVKTIFVYLATFFRKLLFKIVIRSMIVWVEEKDVKLLQAVTA